MSDADEKQRRRFAPKKTPKPKKNPPKTGTWVKSETKELFICCPAMKDTIWLNFYEFDILEEKERLTVMNNT